MSKQTAVSLRTVRGDIENFRTTSQAMQERLSIAMFDGIWELDITEIVQKQVQLAKSGDQKAAAFIMKYCLGVGRHVELQQLNVTNGEP